MIMKKFVSFVAMSALIAGVATSCQKHNTLSEAEKAEGWQLLFDGETMNGWRDFNGTELTNGWRVVDGCIQASGEGGDASGYIVTDKKYANFEAYTELGEDGETVYRCYRCRKCDVVIRYEAGGGIVKVVCPECGTNLVDRL